MENLEGQTASLEMRNQNVT